MMPTFRGNIGFLFLSRGTTGILKLFDVTACVFVRLALGLGGCSAAAGAAAGRGWEVDADADAELLLDEAAAAVVGGIEG